MKEQEKPDYLKQSREYYDNGLTFLSRGRSGKASEMIWGAVAAAIRAVAESRGHEFRTHQGLRAYINGITKELEEPELWRDFKAVEALHVNFYEPSEDLASVEELGKIAKRLIDRLIGLTPVRPRSTEAEQA